METTHDSFNPANVTTLPARRLPRWLSALLKNPVSITGAVLVILFALVAIFAPWIAPPSIPSEPYQIPRDGFMAAPQPPSPSQPLGTTQGQYDLFYAVRVPQTTP